MMVKNKGATPGAIQSATPGASPRQRPVNGGATHTTYTPSVAPAVGGWSKHMQPDFVRAWGGVLGRFVRSSEKSPHRLCGARTRKGTPCKAEALPGKKRCKFHGGLSTGPKTLEGRERIAAAQRKRWAEWRLSRSDQLSASSDD